MGAGAADAVAMVQARMPAAAKDVKNFLFIAITSLLPLLNPDLVGIASGKGFQRKTENLFHPLRRKGML